jgi:CBS domain containing-hemolysin-like protein
MCAICSPPDVPLWCVHSFDYQVFVNDLSLGTAPVAYPIAKILDRVLGVHDAHTYRKAELKSFLQFHRTGEEPLHDDEIAILNGVLELSSKNVETIMTPIRVSISVIPFGMRSPLTAGVHYRRMSSC